MSKKQIKIETKIKNEIKNIRDGDLMATNRFDASEKHH